MMLEKIGSALKAYPSWTCAGATATLGAVTIAASRLEGPKQNKFSITGSVLVGTALLGWGSFETFRSLRNLRTAREGRSLTLALPEVRPLSMTAGFLAPGALQAFSLARGLYRKGDASQDLRYWMTHRISDGGSLGGDTRMVSKEIFKEYFWPSVQENLERMGVNFETFYADVCKEWATRMTTAQLQEELFSEFDQGQLYRLLKMYDREYVVDALHYRASATVARWDQGKVDGLASRMRAIETAYQKDDLNNTWEDERIALIAVYRHVLNDLQLLSRCRERFQVNYPIADALQNCLDGEGKTFVRRMDDYRTKCRSKDEGEGTLAAVIFQYMSLQTYKLWQDTLGIVELNEEEIETKLKALGFKSSEDLIQQINEHTDERARTAKEICEWLKTKKPEAKKEGGIFQSYIRLLSTPAKHRNKVFQGLAGAVYLAAWGSMVHTQWKIGSKAMLLGAAGGLAERAFAKRELKAADVEWPEGARIPAEVLIIWGIPRIEEMQSDWLGETTEAGQPIGGRSLRTRAREFSQRSVDAQARVLFSELALPSLYYLGSMAALRLTLFEHLKNVGEIAGYLGAALAGRALTHTLWETVQGKPSS